MFVFEDLLLDLRRNSHTSFSFTMWSIQVCPSSRAASIPEKETPILIEQVTAWALQLLLNALENIKRSCLCHES
jgi:hypothetical protein